MCVAHSPLVSGIVQYHQVPDEYFTSAVVLSLILAALFGLVYLLIIPQYVQQLLFLFISLSLFISDFTNPSIFPASSPSAQGHGGTRPPRLLHLFSSSLYHVPAHHQSAGNYSLLF